MSNTKKTKYFRGGVAVCFALVGTAATLSDIGKNAERYSALQMQSSLIGLENKYSFLYDHFGRTPHFYQSISQALIKDGYTVLELLTIDEKAVTADSQEDYASLKFPTLPQTMHLHPTNFENHTAVTAGGYPISGIETTKDGQLVLVFENVSESTIIELESEIDKNSHYHEGSDTGRVIFKKGAVGYQLKLKGTRNFTV
ncbi:MAG: hypothetical protein CL578_06150 [Alteromonadaceae bacterium]|uniref:Uncharacterized protein n=1 Tax=Paraglaciecola agarilytica NO2 TaxID=1125747 RepID=A0ABQ0I284_9ALTE|nr:hypothetical protein [Paraglaciecola agarilytica]MBN24615.1 hypothetical protein [Alteromonadaceae bacterium]GAC03427.1 hypothetical protein GAGA_0562 [Paraglaciecola agarilytica NO2]|tara:strand:- start:42558 stop:43154 length:597 start_codon:yes stop_codon:yes gene_type:complete